MMPVTSLKGIDEVKQHCYHVQVAHPECRQWTPLANSFFEVIKCNGILFHLLAINEFVITGLAIPF